MHEHQGPLPALDNEAGTTLKALADYLGLTFETVSRQFSKLKKKQVIALLSSRYIVVPDLELLSAVVNRNRTFNEGQSRAFA